MANIRNNTTSPQPARSGETMQEVRDRWAGEINTGNMDPDWNEPWTPADTRFGTNQMGQTGSMGQMNPMGQGQMSQMGQTGQMNSMRRSNGLQMGQGGQTNSDLHMQNNLPDEVIESPTTLNEAYLGSLKTTLLRNKGNYIVATFLVGTQNTVSWEGILYDVGNDYVTIYQEGRDRYIVSDIYSLRYMEFYDTRRRELCNQLLQERGWQGM